MKQWTRKVLLGAGGLALGGCGGFGTETDGSAPVVEITSPRSGSVRGRVDFSANVLDDTGVARVRFLVDGVLLFEDISAPFVTDWLTTTATDGPHTLSVDAEDVSGNRASASRSVTVNNAAPN